MRGIRGAIQGVIAERLQVNRGAITAKSVGDFCRESAMPARLTLKVCIMTTGEFAGHLVAGFCVSSRRNIPVAAQSVL